MNTLQLTFLFLGIITALVFFLSNVFYGWLIKRASQKIQTVNMMTSFGKPLWSLQREDITFELGYLPFSSSVKPLQVDELDDQIAALNQKSIVIQILIFLISGLYLIFNQIDFFIGFETVRKMEQFAVESIDYASFKSFFLAHASSKITYFFFLLNSFSVLLMCYSFFQFILVKYTTVLAVIGLLYTLSMFYFFYKMESHISYVQIGVYWITSLLLSALFLILSTKLISNK